MEWNPSFLSSGLPLLLVFAERHFGPVRTSAFNAPALLRHSPGIEVPAGEQQRGTKVPCDALFLSVWLGPERQL